MDCYDKHWLEKCLKIAYTHALKEKITNIVYHKNRLLVDGKCYTADNIFKIPHAFNPLYIFTPRTANKVAFYTSFSPLSNHFPCSLEIDGIKYNCMEQYFMHQKAAFFGDQETAALILRTKDPQRQKFLGRKVKNFEKNIWGQQVHRILWEGLLAKFKQNKNCSDFLRNTENRQLYEAHDPIYGVGINLFDSNIWDERTHRGKNLMGIFLQRVRTYLFKNTTENLCGWVDSINKMENMDSVKSFEIGSRKKATINEYKNASYIHFYDMAKGKSFTFSSSEFKDLMSKKSEIEQCFIYMNRRREKREEEIQTTSKVPSEKRTPEQEDFFLPYGMPKAKHQRVLDYGDVPSASHGPPPQPKLSDY